MWHCRQNVVGLERRSSGTAWLMTADEAWCPAPLPTLGTSLVRQRSSLAVTLHQRSCDRVWMCASRLCPWGEGSAGSRTTLEGCSAFECGGSERAGPRCCSSSFDGPAGWQGSNTESGPSVLGRMGTVWGGSAEETMKWLDVTWTHPETFTVFGLSVSTRVTDEMENRAEIRRLCFNVWF